MTNKDEAEYSELVASGNYWNVTVLLEDGTTHRFKITGLHLLGNGVSSHNLTNIQSITLD